MIVTESDILQHATEARRLSEQPQLLEDLKCRLLRECREFLLSLEQCAATSEQNKADLVESAYAAFAQLQNKPLQFFADHYDCPAASLLKQIGKIGKGWR